MAEAIGLGERAAPESRCEAGNDALLGNFAGEANNSPFCGRPRLLLIGVVGPDLICELGIGEAGSDGTGAVGLGLSSFLGRPRFRLIRGVMASGSICKLGTVTQDPDVAGAWIESQWFPMLTSNRAWFEEMCPK